MSVGFAQPDLSAFGKRQLKLQEYFDSRSKSHAQVSAGGDGVGSSVGSRVGSGVGLVGVGGGVGGSDGSGSIGAGGR